MRREVTIGWTLNNRADRTYVSFSDGYREGVLQHEVTFTLDVADDVNGESIADAVFLATNAPSVAPGTLAAQILAEVAASGYTGRVEGEDYIGHYSLSVGDTVTVDGTKYACANIGWKTVGEAS